MDETPAPYQESIEDSSSLCPLLTVAQVMTLLHCGRSKVYALIACEALPAIRFGRAIRISQNTVETLLARSKSGG